MSLNPKRKSKKIFFWFSGCILVGALLYLILIPPPVIVEAARVSRGDFRETILADGILRSKEKYTVPAFADGDIKRMPLKVGDPVKRGQIITELFWDVKYEPIRSPVPGVISKVYRESAGPIRRGDPIVEIIDPRQLELVAELLTTDAIRLQEGAPVELFNWPGVERLKGTVTRISKAGFIKPSALGVEEERTEVIANLPNLPPEITARAGNTFHVDVSFQISETVNVLKMPVGALFRDGSSWAVYIIASGRAVMKRLEVAGKNPREVAIKSGIAEGELVIIYPGDLIKEGSRVRARDKPIP